MICVLIISFKRVIHDNLILPEFYSVPNVQYLLPCVIKTFIRPIGG